MKKAIILFAAVALLPALFCGCIVQLEHDFLPADTSAAYAEVMTNTTNNDEATEGAAISEWKTAYLDFLEPEKDEYLFYALVYIDDDDIPELYLSGNCEATGDSICTYKDGNVIEQPLNRIGGGRYIVRSGDVINQNGNMGHIYTHVYKLTEDGFSLIFDALSVERFVDLGNDKYEFLYEYSVEGMHVSENEYTAAVNAAFCFEKSIRLDENAVEYDAIRQQILEYK